MNQKKKKRLDQYTEEYELVQIPLLLEINEKTKKKKKKYSCDTFLSNDPINSESAIFPENLIPKSVRTNWFVW